MQFSQFLNKDLSPLQNFTLSAVCVKNKRAKRLCISSSCKSKSIYQCGQSQQKCECHFSHKKCSSIGLQAFCEKFFHYKKQLSEELKQFLLRFEKIYSTLEKTIKKQVNLFKNHYQKILFDDTKYSIEKKINQKTYQSITSFQIHEFLSSIQNHSQQINCGKLTLNEARQVDKKISELFRFVEELYKEKIVKRKISTQTKFRSFSSGCLQKSISSEPTTSHTRKSSVFQKSSLKHDAEANDIFAKNLSVILQKKVDNFLQVEKMPQSLLLRPPRIDLDYPRIISSKIIDKCSIVNHLIGKKVKSYQLQWRASENAFELKRFYEYLQNQGSKKEKLYKNKIVGSLFLIKTEFGNTIGAYSQISLIHTKSKILQQSSELTSDDQSSSNLNPQKKGSISKLKFISDIRSSTFLFSLNLKQKYILTDPEKAIYLGEKSIGFGQTDFRIRNRANQIKQSYCRIGDTFKINQENKSVHMDYDSKNLKIIGSRYGKKFKILEWEYFTVVLQHKP